MSLSKPQLWIAIVTGAIVLTAALVDTRRASPGGLAAVHGRVPELAEASSCDACHGGWFTSMTSACLACHEGIGGQIDASAGLHGALDRDLAQRCARCHSDHHGADFSIVNAQSFAQAGVPDRAEFDHVMVGFAMDGAHLELGCTECHENADRPVLPEGATRFVGLEQECSTCHEDSHEGRMQISCTKCHGQEAFDVLESTGHREFLPLVGGHRDVACDTCHAASNTLYSLDALGTARHRRTGRTCLDCHESPHDRDFLEGVAALASLPVGSGCGSCHKASHETFRDEAIRVTGEQHERSGFPLSPPHDEARCEDCHAAETERFERRYPGRSPDACRACHDSPHGTQFDTGPLAEEGCLACHEREHFEPHAFTAERHAATELPLTGRHGELDCSECHLEPFAGAPREFRGTESRCESCHDDAHDGFFGADVREAADCALCHETTTFSDVPPEDFDHGAWTGFAVEGAHAQSDCESCHPRAAMADDHGRTFGRVAEHFGAFRGCVTCHLDPHQGRFDGRHLPQQFGTRTGCARCHEPSSFRSLPDGFEHGLWTGFELEGVHGSVGCSKCHAPMRAPDDVGRTWSRARGDRCADCHADPHAGQFRAGEVTDCRRCHDSASSFSELVFDHEVDARFALGEAHAELACAECHESTAVGASEVVRYRPLPTRCVDCHGVHEEVLLRRRGGKR